jgi:hypothetical protein
LIGGMEATGHEAEAKFQKKRVLLLVGQSLFQ